MTDATRATVVPRLVGAGITAVAALVVAATVDITAARIVAAILALISGVVAVVGVSRASRKGSFVGAAAIPVAVLVVGTPIAGIVDGVGTAVTGVDAAALDETDNAWSGDLDIALDEAFAEADRLVPGGSDAVMSLGFGSSQTVAVLDPRTGEQVRSSRSTSDGDWDEPNRSDAVGRDTFGRADLPGFSLAEAWTAATRAATTLNGGTAPAIEDDDRSVTIQRRSGDDRLLVAEFGIGDVDVEVGADGALPDTLDAGRVDTVVASATRAMRAAGLDPRRARIDDFDFRSTVENTDMPAASSASGGGFYLYFDGGRVGAITVVPGRFPQVRPSTSTRATSEDAFRITDVTTTGLRKARDDLMRRNHVPQYDADRVGFMIGVAPDDMIDNDVNRIRMSVGTSSSDAAGVYELDGRFVREGTT